MVEVQMTQRECMHAVTQGGMRQIQSYYRGMTHKEAKPGKENDWNNNIIGCLGEMAVAKHLDVFWSGASKLRAPDVGDLEIKSTDWSNGKLRIGKDWPNDAIYVLTIVNLPIVKIAGWIAGGKAKQDQWWYQNQEGREPMYWVPQDQLTPIEDLKPSSQVSLLDS